MHLFKKLKAEKKQKVEGGSAETNKKLLSEEVIKNWLSLYKSNTGNWNHPEVLQDGGIEKAKHRLENSSTFFYIKDWLMPQEGKLLMQIIQGQDKKSWVNLHHSNRRLQKWGNPKIREKSQFLKKREFQNNKSIID